MFYIPNATADSKSRYSLYINGIPSDKDIHPVLGYIYCALCYNLAFLEIGFIPVSCTEWNHA